MKDLSRIKYKDGVPYILYIYKDKGRLKRDYHYGEIRNCLECGNKCFIDNRLIRNNIGFYCSTKCSNRLKNNPAWKGGRIKNFLGYLKINSPNHPFRMENAYVYEHRLIVEKYIGRYLKNSEIVHHINKDRTDNRIENLMVINNHGAHLSFDKGYKINPKYIIFDGSKLNHAVCYTR